MKQPAYDKDFARMLEWLKKYNCYAKSNMKGELFIYKKVEVKDGD